LRHGADPRRAAQRQHAAPLDEREKAEQRLEQGGLAGAVRSQDAQRGPGADRQVQRRQERRAVADDGAFESDQFQGRTRYQSGGGLSTRRRANYSVPEAKMVAMTPISGRPSELNRAVDAQVAAGRYLEALALAERFVSRERDTASELLVQINLAEAEYNLGRWGAAWERLRDLDPLAAAFP